MARKKKPARDDNRTAIPVHVSPTFHDDVTELCSRWRLHLGEECSDRAELRAHIADLEPAWIVGILSGIKLRKPRRGAADIAEERRRHRETGEHPDDIAFPRRGSTTDGRELAAKLLGVTLKTFYEHKDGRPLSARELVLLELHRRGAIPRA